MWNTKYNCLTASRNFGKSFLLVIFAALKMLLYPNLKIYLISSKGNQAIETFLKLEDLAKQRIESIPTLKDVFISEVDASANSDGFTHDKGSHKVSVLNHSTLFTLNSIPDNVRGKRASLLLIDESGFTDEDLINVCLPFIAQKADFKMGVDDKFGTGEKFNIDILKKPVPTQVIFSSSASESTHIHAHKYKEFAIKMLAGDSNYFVGDIPCEIPLHPMADGEFVKPLLEQSEIDDMMKQNQQKGLREFYNKFTTDGGDEQFIKWSKIRECEKFTLPQLKTNGSDEFFAISYDSALQSDNSIIMVMKLIHDEVRGWYGQIVNIINMKDHTKKGNIQLKSQDQIQILKDTILNYNGLSPDYKNIKGIAVDAGHAAMLVFLDFLLADWKDKTGKKHKGLIDPNHPRYKNEVSKHRNAWRKLKAISPHKDRKELCEDLESLVNDGLIEFPYEYDEKGTATVEDENGDFKIIDLTESQIASLKNMDYLKNEITSIHRMGAIDNPNYGLPKNKIKKMHDDRFYALALLGNILINLRRDEQLKKSGSGNKIDISKFKSCATAVSF